MLAQKFAWILGAERVIAVDYMDGKMNIIELETVLLLQGGAMSAIIMASQAVRKNGNVSLVGVYGLRYNQFPLGYFFSRNITLKMGQCPATAYVKHLLEWIKEGKIDSTDIITYRLKLDEGERGYEIFDQKQANCIKVILKP